MEQYPARIAFLKKTFTYKCQEKKVCIDGPNPDFTRVIEPLGMATLEV